MLCSVEVWAHDRWRIPLPAGHKFPIDKYRLLRERVEDSVTVLESTQIGRPVYRALGYRELGALQMWERRRPVRAG